jgi:YHS domain-containing protein
MINKSKFLMPSISVILVYIAATFFVAAQELNMKGNVEAVPLAIQGYDIISYYKNDVARKGNSSFQATYKGKRYTFISQENQQLFANNPEKYLPKFDGFCAHSASQQKVVAGDPSVYVIDQGNLYFFNNTTAKNVWNQEGDEKIARANKHWKYVAKKINEDLKAKKLWKEKNTVELFTF